MTAIRLAQQGLPPDRDGSAASPPTGGADGPGLDEAEGAGVDDHRYRTARATLVRARKLRGRTPPQADRAQLAIDEDFIVGMRAFGIRRETVRAAEARNVAILGGCDASEARRRCELWVGHASDHRDGDDWWRPAHAGT